MTASATIETGEKDVFVAITPCRIMDTRPGPLNVGPRNAPLIAGETHTINARGVNGNCTIPADAVALGMNVTVDQPTASSFLTVFPSDATRPLASNLNWIADQSAQPNAVTTKMSATGQVSFYNNAGTVHVIADIVGYYVDHNHNDLYYTKTQADAMAPVVKAHIGIVNVGLGTVAITGATNITANFNTAGEYIEVTLTGQTMTETTYAIFATPERVNSSSATADRTVGVFFSGGKAQITVYDVSSVGPLANDIFLLIYKL